VSPATALTLDGIVKRYDRATVLDGVSLDVAAGGFLALLGPSGCGKSTLLRIIAGLEAQDSGTVAIGGETVDALRPAERDVAMVFQSYALYPHLCVRDNIALPLRMRRMTAAQRLPWVGPCLPGSRSLLRNFDTEVTRVADLLGLADLLRRRPGQLSGGQRQRVALARAMVRNPALFLMDEPLSNLDAKLRVTMRGEITALHRRLGTTFVYVTHDQAEAMTMADRIAVMSHGRLLQVGPPSEIYERPASLEVAGFVGSPPVNTVAAAHLELPGRPTSAATLGFRPEAAALADADAPDGLPCRVARVEYLGGELHVHVQLTASPAHPIVVRLDGAAREGWTEGRAAMLRVDPARLLWFDNAGMRVSP
jgi:multiple sugar transport system ATP-binding protein